MAGSHNLKKENGARMLLGKQPARMLLVDASYPLLTFAEVVKDLCNTLENIFAISTNIGGPSRMPFFGLMSLSQYPELLLPLSHVKNNYSRIETSINDLCNIIGEGQRRHTNTTDCVIQGIQDACAHFHRQMKATVPQAGGLGNQLELILLTCQPGQKVQKQIDEAIQLMNLENVKRIQVVVLNLDVDYPAFEESEILGSQSSLKSNTSNSSSLSGGLVDIVSLDPDCLSLQNFFNAWLLDNSTDSEHLHIILPSDNAKHVHLASNEWIQSFDSDDIQEMLGSPEKLELISQKVLRTIFNVYNPTVSQYKGPLITVPTKLRPAKEEKVKDDISWYKEEDLYLQSL